ncbi:MAG: hypothetical protein ACK8QZ_05465 [Anaerolineales bacterium]
MIRKRLFILLFLVVSLACALLLYPVIQAIFFALLIAFQPNQDAERPLSTVFDNLVCEPPCWNNITPGQTTYEEAYNLLTKKAVVDGQIKRWKYNIVFYYYPESSTKPFDETKDEVSFRFDKNGILQEIYFGKSSPKISLSYAVSRLGEPDYAIRKPYGERWMTVLYYPERGIEVWCMSFKCTLDSEVWVYFYSPAIFFNNLVRELEFRQMPSP